MAYTNSSLIDYTIKSPNNSGTRKNKITRITPHCTVGQMSAQQIGNCFKPTSKKASCNYGIGYDGQIVLVVDEANRSWCSSSSDNDNKAITIEVASDNYAPYAFKDAAYNKLVELCIDICKRNELNKIIWIADKNTALNYTVKDGECLLTVHRWFANKSCPGDWMYNRMAQFAEQVNAGLGSKSTTTSTTTTTTTSTSASTSSQTAEQTIWNYLLSKIGNEYGVAGLMGNLYYESGLSSINVQQQAETKLKVTDAQYTANVDNGTYTNFVKDSYGYGLAQWTYYTRKQKLLDYAKSKGTSIGDLNMQLEYLMSELTNSYNSTVLTPLKNATTIRVASDAVMTKFENPLDQSETVKAARATYGQKFYDKYATKTTAAETQPSGSTVTSKVYQDSVTTIHKATYAASKLDKNLAGTYTVTATSLNVRNGAGTAYTIMTTIPKGTKVKNYGYYSLDSAGTKWYYVQFIYNGNNSWCGFVSSKYVKK